MGDAMFSLGSIYFELNKLNDAIETYTKSAEYHSQIEPSSDYALCYYNIGLCYMDLENYPKAEQNFEQSAKIYATLKIDASEILNLQKGILYKNKNKTELATTIFNEIISRNNASNIYKTKAEALYQLGDIELKLEHYNLAANYLNRALKQNAIEKNLEQKVKIVLDLSIVYDKLLDQQKSYKFLKQHIQLKDSLFLLNNEKLDANDYEAFKEGERMKAIEQMAKENEAQQRSTKFAKLISFLAIALISILSLLSLSLYKNNIIRSKSNLLLQEKNNELQVAKDKAEKASKARADFLSTVSHELRTPLNAINGMYRYINRRQS